MYDISLFHPFGAVCAVCFHPSPPTRFLFWVPKQRNHEEKKRVNYINELGSLKDRQWSIEIQKKNHQGSKSPIVLSSFRFTTSPERSVEAVLLPTWSSVHTGSIDRGPWKRSLVVFWSKIGNQLPTPVPPAVFWAKGWSIPTDHPKCNV